jgi:phosphoadenosine phosphosulfate reductase
MSGKQLTRLSGADIARAAQRLDRAHPREVLRWALDTFGDRFAVVTALQVEGLVAMDLARQIDSDVRIITIDTGRLPEETYEYIDTVRARLGVTIEVLTPDPAAVGAMVARHGTNLFRRDRALRFLCCHVRKIEPLGRAMVDLDAWASGLRRDGGAARAGTRTVEADPTYPGIVKVNPLANWTRADAMAYVREQRLPLHPLYERGYTSIGCAPCTRAVAPGQDERVGRWWWEDDSQRECGLHFANPSERFDDFLATLHRDLEQAPGAAGVHDPEGNEQEGGHR